MKALRNPRIASQFKSFVVTDTIGDDVNVFGKYRPPNPAFSYIHIENKPVLVEKFLELFYDMMFDEEAVRAFDHLLNVTAYLLRTGKKPNVFFIKYSKTGDTGKTFLDKVYAKLFGKYSLIELSDEQSNEMHNGGLACMLYRSRDELTADNYQTRKANANIKRITNDKMAARRMRQDTVQEDDYAIDVLNCNEADLYGMLNSNDPALHSRLCIIRFKEHRMKESKYFANNTVVDDPSFAYSFYMYLKNKNIQEFINDQGFNRYDSSIVRDQLKKLVSKPMIELFIEECDTLRWIPHKFKGDDELYDVIKVNDLKESYNRYMIGQKYKLSSTLDDELKKLGIVKHKDQNGKDLKVKILGNAYFVYKRKHVEENIVVYKCDKIGLRFT